MMKVLLVDDEPLVLVGLQSMLKWEDYDAQVVGTARNGAQALDLIGELRPELVITDIKMPVMNGLELLKVSQERSGELPLFIMLTSFEEFQFVKEAISRQAVDYLVKLELTEQSLASAVRKAQERLGSVRSGTAASAKGPTERFGMQPFYDRFFVRLFNNLFENEEQFLTQKRELGVDLSFDAYAVCYCELQDLDTQGMNQEKLMNLYSSTTRMVWETVTKYMACYITSLDTRHFNITFCLSEQESPIYEKVLREVLEKTAEVVYNYFSVQIACTVGTKVAYPRALSESYYTARLCRLGEGEQIAFFDQGSGADGAGQVYDMSRYKESLTQAFEEMDADTLDSAITHIVESLRGDPVNRLRAMDAACNLLFMALTQLTDGEEVVSQIFASETEGYKCIYRKRTIPEITAWMDTLKEGLLQALRGRKRGYKEKVIGEIKEYIRSNLDKRLALGDVAAVFGFSPNYLSQLFARQAGCSFVEYITGEKVAAAKEMMAQGNNKVYEIAERLGFENAFYFSKVFKKVTGCSPREYIQGK